MSSRVTRLSVSNVSAHEAADLQALPFTAATHAKQNGWTVLDIERANAKDKTAPTLQCSRTGDPILMIWCRGQKAEISKGTQEWIDHFASVGCECIVMRPSDLFTVAERLARPSEVSA